MLCSSLKGKRIARIASVKFAIDQVHAQVQALVDSDADVTVICAPSAIPPRSAAIHAVKFLPVDIKRSIDLLGDLSALIRLWRIFRKGKFDIVHSTTPKAGLLVAISSLLAGVPLRLHTFTGQVWATRSGLSRYLLKSSDKLIAKFSTVTYADSGSQIAFLEAEGVAKRGGVKLLGSGSLAGVDTKRFDPALFSDEETFSTRRSLAIPDDAKVLVFVGRLHVEKGLRELYEAYYRLASEMPELHLIMVGPEESSGEMFAACVQAEEPRSRVHFVGAVADPERYLAVGHALCLPSCREGFGTVVLEAASMGLPTVATNIYGLRDAVIDSETGLLVSVGDSNALQAAISNLLWDERVRSQLGANARARVLKEFDTRILSKLLLDEYRILLGKI